MENLPDRIYFKDLQSRFVRVNRAHATWLGAASPEEVIGKSDYDFFSQNHAQGAFTEEAVIMYTGRPMVGQVQRITKRDGTEAWGSTTKLPWRDDTGRIIGTFGVTRNVTAAKEAEEKLLQEKNLLRTIIDHLQAVSSSRTLPPTTSSTTSRTSASSASSTRMRPAAALRSTSSPASAASRPWPTIAGWSRPASR
jgi:PAS domain S-box-containing protein